MAILFLLLEFLPEICWKEDAEEIFAFRCLTWGLNRGFSFNKPTHYLLDYNNLCNLAEEKLPESLAIS